VCPDCKRASLIKMSCKTVSHLLPLLPTYSVRPELAWHECGWLTVMVPLVCFLEARERALVNVPALTT